MKIGDGVTPAKDLPYAMDGEKANEMIVSEFSEESNENPVLSPGDKIKTLCGKLLKKFTYIETLLGKKVNTSDIYDGTDSSSTTKVATANSVRQVNEKADNNTNQINQLNSKLAYKIMSSGDVLALERGYYYAYPECINLPPDTDQAFWLSVNGIDNDNKIIEAIPAGSGHKYFYKAKKNSNTWLGWEKYTSVI